MTTRLALELRLAAALLMVLTMVAVGWVQRSPWVVLLATPVFTVLYALGKWNSWKLAWRIGGAPQIVLSVLVTLPIQAVVAGVCYVVGVGLGRLVAGNRALAPLAGTDVITMAVLLGVGAVISTVVIRLESAAPAAAGIESTPGVLLTDDGATAEPEIELDVDPKPLTLDTFFVSPEHWRTNAAREALELRSGPVRKPSLAADDDMIAAAETRLGVRLPDTLRALYRKLNGGYVGWLYVPLVPNPGPVYDDWRGAFSIDYSSLAPLDKLRTVAEHYSDFTDDPEDLPANAEHLIVLQARYGDMTLLDYSAGPRPRVLIVDYDKASGEDPVDLVFEDFDQFFAALRGERGRLRTETPARDLGAPMEEAPEDQRASRFWGKSDPHPFYRNAINARTARNPRWPPTVLSSLPPRTGSGSGSPWTSSRCGGAQRRRGRHAVRAVHRGCRRARRRGHAASGTARIRGHAGRAVGPIGFRGERDTLGAEASGVRQARRAGGGSRTGCSSGLPRPPGRRPRRLHRRESESSAGRGAAFRALRRPPRPAPLSAWRLGRRVRAARCGSGTGVALSRAAHSDVGFDCVDGDFEGALLFVEDVHRHLIDGGRV